MTWNVRPLLVSSPNPIPVPPPIGQLTLSADGLVDSIGLNFHPEFFGSATAIPTSADTPSGSVLPFSALSLSFLIVSTHPYVAGPNIADGTTALSATTSTLTLSKPILGDIPAGTLITFGQDVALQTSADAPSGSVLSFVSTTGVVVGQSVLGVNIPQGAAVVAVTPTSVTMSLSVLGDVPAGNTILFVSGEGYGSPNWDNVILPQLQASGVRWLRAGPTVSSGDNAQHHALYQYRMQQVAAIGGIKISVVRSADTMSATITPQNTSVQGTIDLTATLTVSSVNFGATVPGLTFNEAQPGTQVIAQLTGQGTTSGGTLTGGSSTVFASGSITFNTNPVASNVIILNGTTVTFVNSSPSGSQVQIGADLPTTLTNLLNFLQASVDTNIDECNYSVASATLNISYNTLISGSTLTGGNATTAAHGFVTYASNQAPGNTLSLGSTIVTFVALTPVGNQVQIGASLAATMGSLQAFLSGSPDPNISLCTYTVSGGATLNITYGTVGTVGNSFAIKSGTGANSWTLAASLGGGIGTYSVSLAQNFGPGTLTGSYGLLTAASMQFFQNLDVGDPIATLTSDPNTNILPGTVVTGLGTGSGGPGTYYVSPSQNVPTAVFMAYTDFVNDVFPFFTSNGSNWGQIEGPNEPSAGKYIGVYQKALWNAVKASPLVGPSGANILVAGPGMTAPAAVTVQITVAAPVGSLVITVASTTFVIIGAAVKGSAIASGTYVVGVSGGHVTLSQPTIAPIIVPSSSANASFSLWAGIGDVSNYIDRGNVHPYSPVPGDTGNLENYIYFDTPLPYGTKPIVVSEVGWTTALDQTSITAVAAPMAARYMPRLFVYHYSKQGTTGGVNTTIPLTLFFQMIPNHLPKPTDVQAGFGLINYDGSFVTNFVNQNSGLSINPWAMFKNLMNMFSDPGPPFTVVPLNYSITGGDATVLSLAFQRRNGVYMLAVWLAVKSWQQNNTVQITSASTVAGNSFLQFADTSMFFVGTRLDTAVNTNISANTPAGSTVITVASTAGVVAGVACQGAGIAAGSTVLSVASPNVTLSLPTTAGITAPSPVTFANIPVGTTVQSVTPGFVTLSAPVIGSGINAGDAITLHGSLLNVPPQSVSITVPYNYVSLTSQIFNEDGTLTTTLIPLVGGIASGVLVYDRLQVFTLN